MGSPSEAGEIPREMLPARYRIYDTPEPFTILSNHGREVAMEWLTSKEHGRPTTVPTVILWVDNLDTPGKGYVSLISSVLRRRDRERARCGLPPYWEPLAHELEVNHEAHMRRLVRKYEEAS